MVNTRQLIKILISIDTLISFEGIIPSVSVLQNNLLGLLNLLRKALKDENVPDNHAEQLCWLIAKWLDERILPHLDQHTGYRNAFSLEFNIFQNIKDDSAFAKQLAALLHESSEPVTHYARQIGQVYFSRAMHDKALATTLASLPVISFPPGSSLSESQQRAYPVLAAVSCKTDSSPWRPAPMTTLCWLAAFLMTLWILSLVYLDK